MVSKFENEFTVQTAGLNEKKTNDHLMPKIVYLYDLKINLNMASDLLSQPSRDITSVMLCRLINIRGSFRNYCNADNIMIKREFFPKLIALLLQTILLVYTQAIKISLT